MYIFVLIDIWQWEYFFIYIHTKRRIDGEIKGWGIFLITTANSRGFFLEKGVHVLNPWFMQWLYNGQWLTIPNLYRFDGLI